MQYPKLRDIDMPRVVTGMITSGAVYFPVDMAGVRLKMMVVHSEPAAPVDTVVDTEDIFDHPTAKRYGIVVGLRWMQPYNNSSLLAEFHSGTPVVNGLDYDEIARHRGIMQTVVEVGVLYVVGMIRGISEQVELERNEHWQAFCHNHRSVWNRYRDDVPEEVKRAIITNGN